MVRGEDVRKNICDRVNLPIPDRLRRIEWVRGGDSANPMRVRFRVILLAEFGPELGDHRSEFPNCLQLVPNSSQQISSDFGCPDTRTPSGRRKMFAFKTIDSSGAPSPPAKNRQRLAKPTAAPGWSPYANHTHGGGGIRADPLACVQRPIDWGLAQAASCNRTMTVHHHTTRNKTPQTLSNRHPPPHPHWAGGGHIIVLVRLGV